MTQTEKNIWIRLASGTVKGPFPASKVRDAYRVGKVPIDSFLSASEDGAWKPVAACFRVAPSTLPTITEPAPDRVAPLTTPTTAIHTPAITSESTAQMPTIENLELPTANLKEILLFAWRRLLHNYRTIVLRSIVTMLFVLAFTFLPAIIALMGVINNAIFRGDGGSGFQLSIPILRDLDPTGLITTFASTLFLVPFGMMFASSGSFMIVGVLRKSKEARWSTLFAWRSHFLTMYAIGVLGSANEVTSFIVGRIISGQKEPGVAADFLSKFAMAAPWGFIVLAGLLVLENPCNLTFKTAIQQAYRICLNSRGAGFIAIGIAAAAAVVSFVAFVIPSLLLGFPLLLVVLATIFMMRDKLQASQLVPIPQVAQLLTPSSQSTSSEPAP